MLHNYRKTHQFLGPCCLCSLLTPLREDSHFTEAAIYVPVFGRYAGEYVAECARSHCGYLGQLSSWLKAYRNKTYMPPPTSTVGKNLSQSWSPSENIPYQRSVARLLVMMVPDTYLREDSDTICPPQVYHSTELEFMSSRTLKRTYALYAPAGDADTLNTDVPPPAEYVDLGYETDWREIVKLDRLDRPGLSEVKFFGLFAKCSVCKLVMAHQVFSFHCCVLQTDGLELTDVGD